ncbi:MAG: translation initiation factor IF-2, partial [Betaproteobacteria bacterium]|nr:translation initiation factor IF-2 [Betaproteobacteria bacterium]
MAQQNVTQFAKELGVPPAQLIEQLQAAGVKKAFAAETTLTEVDKTQLLDYFKQSHGRTEEKKKITLTRRSTTEIKKADSTTGKARTIQVEVRKKRVLVKRDVTAPAEEAVEAVAAPQVPAAAPKPVLDAAEIALREEEARRQAALAERQAEEAARKLALEQERRKKAEPVAQAAPPVVEQPVQEPAAPPEPAAKPAAAPVVAKAAEPAKPTPRVGERVYPEIRRDAVLKAKPAEPGSGTLHKPAAPAGADKKPAKKAKTTEVKPAPGAWREEAANKRRAIKTR